MQFGDDPSGKRECAKVLAWCFYSCKSRSHSDKHLIQYRKKTCLLASARHVCRGVRWMSLQVQIWWNIGVKESDLPKQMTNKICLRTQETTNCHWSKTTWAALRYCASIWRGNSLYVFLLFHRQFSWWDRIKWSFFGLLVTLRYRRRWTTAVQL